LFIEPPLRPKNVESCDGWLVSRRSGHQLAGREDQMRLIQLFLVGYFILIVGVGLALWEAGVLTRVAPIWMGFGAIVAVGLVIVLSVSSGKPAVTEELQK
jgi:hypothetical protein